MKLNNFGSIGNHEGTEFKDIVIDKPAISVGDAIIGMLLGPVGIIYVARKAFENGATAYDQTQNDIFKELGLLHDVQ